MQLFPVSAGRGQSWSAAEFYC